jgi:methanogenic corrinoid protein MtbC1
MLKWCSYCQQFMREIPPYDDFGVTHGLCPNCEAEHFDPDAPEEIGHALFLSAIFQRLFDAGRRSDIGAAGQIVETAISANCRPVDILIGMIAPMLYEIGEEWKRGALSVEGEHRFTAFCEEVLSLLADKAKADKAALPRSGNGASFLLMNAPGNAHTLAIRILALWLESTGSRARVIDEQPGLERLMQELATSRPTCVLLSMALAEQHGEVASIAQHLQALPEISRPRVIVGGYPVKVGLVQSIPGAELVSDISQLHFN